MFTGTAGFKSVFVFKLGWSIVSCLFLTFIVLAVF